MIPEGAIKKSWGWQKQIYADDEREVWLCYGESGKTSYHYHQHHDQRIQNISGAQVVKGAGFVGFYHYICERGCEIRLACGEKHQLHFVSPGLFIEVYEKVVEPGCTRLHTPAAVDDIIRE